MTAPRKLLARDVLWNCISFVVIPQYKCALCGVRLGDEKHEAGWTAVTKKGKPVLLCFSCGEKKDGK